jgi:hypothetical protein
MEHKKTSHLKPWNIKETSPQTMEHKKTSHLKPWNIKDLSPQTMEHKKISHLKPWNIKRSLTSNHRTYKDLSPQT